MSKLKNILLSVFLSATASHAPAAFAADKAPENSGRPATETVNTPPPQKLNSPQKKDPFAKYREAEKIAVPALVFLEGCSRQAYQDACKIWTVGIGNTVRPDGKPVTAKDFLKDDDEIRRYVAHHLEKHIYPYLDTYIKRSLKPHEMAAIISLTYNCGIKALGSNNGRIAKAVNQGNSDEIAKAFLTKVATRTRRFSNGLAVRRCLEIMIYNNQITLSDINNFYIGGYRGLEYKDITKVKKTKTFYGRIPKTDSISLAKVKSFCARPPEAEIIKDIAWYGGDKKVSEFMTPDKYGKNQTAQTIKTFARPLDLASVFLSAKMHLQKLPPLKTQPTLYQKARRGGRRS